MRTREKTLGALVAALVVCGPVAAEAGGLDAFNRANRSFNFWLIDHVVEPVSRGYNFVVPKWGQARVHNVLGNLERPRDFVNSLLQAKPGRAARHLGALLLDSTVGIAGAFRPSERLLGRESPETTGETLGVYGIPAGTFLVLPVLGETCPRCLVGTVGDLALYPLFWIPASATTGLYATGGAEAVGGVNLLAKQMPGRGADEDEWESFRARIRSRAGYEEARELFFENLEFDVAD